eukprot:4816420-Prymnesium_polylepis.1
MLRRSGLTYFILRPGELEDRPGGGRIAVSQVRRRGERANAHSILSSCAQHTESMCTAHPSRCAQHASFASLAQHASLPCDHPPPF